MGITVSAKRVMKLMTKHGMVPLFKSAKRYSSYKGELTRAPENLVNRDFHADGPNMLRVTDLTEFSIPAGKAYLSPLIDCYDGLPVAWTIGTSPNAELADGMLSDACSTLGEGDRPVIHSDRGGVVPFCWTSLSLLFDYATSPSSRRRPMMLMPNSVLMRLSRYQTM